MMKNIFKALNGSTETREGIANFDEVAWRRENVL
jgi:hypothetical protein